MSIRRAYFIGFMVASLLLLTGFYFQWVEGIMPCPLCMLQRFVFAWLIILFFMGILLHAKRRSRMVINVLASLASLSGVFLAGRQTWLQHFPSANGSECGVSLQYMLNALPMNEVVQKIFQGSAECTQRGMEFLYLNMAEWALIWFILFLLVSLCLLFEEFKAK